MSQNIIVEAVFLLDAFVRGAVLVLIYDIIRIFRRVIKHNVLFIALEDIIYWISMGIMVFILFFKNNNGVIRVFALVAMGIGVCFYLLFLSEYIVKYTSKIINFFKNALFKLIKMVFRPIYKLTAYRFRRWSHERKKKSDKTGSETPE